MNIIYIDATDRFLDRLGIIDPEQRSHRRGSSTFRRKRKIGEVDFLAQGTLSRRHRKRVIRQHRSARLNHHNVGGLPAHDSKLLEPLRFLFKKTMKLVSQQLGLSEDMVWRQPFPGQAIRCIGDVTREKLEITRRRFI
jgi:GMP synthase (glutamine-hydrolysing)